MKHPMTVTSSLGDENANAYLFPDNPKPPGGRNRM